jgi:hypothetical protein
LPMPPTLSAFRLREPIPSCHELWHALSSAGAWQAFLRPPTLASSHRKARRDECHRTRVSRATHRLGCVAWSTQRTFDWLDLPFREGRPPRLNVIVCPLRPEHPLHEPQMPALSGLWASRACYPVEPQRHWRAARSTREMLLTNLCNRLVVTSTLGVTPSPSPGLSPSYPPRTSSSFRLGGEPSLLPEAILGDAGLPLLASPALGRPRSWCCAGQLLPGHHPERDARCLAP